MLKFSCQWHRLAPTLYACGFHGASSDEMTGIQALERLYATRAMRPGKLEQQEFEYEPYGTSLLQTNSISTNPNPGCA